MPVEVITLFHAPAAGAADDYRLNLWRSQVMGATALTCGSTYVFLHDRSSPAAGRNNLATRYEALHAKFKAAAPPRTGSLCNVAVNMHGSSENIGSVADNGMG